MASPRVFAIGWLLVSYVTVARIGELADGDIKPVTCGDVEMILYRSGDEYFASQRKCLHQGFDLADGIVSSGFVVCAAHGWRFDARTGRHEISPETCLVTYRVRQQEDLLQVDPTPMWQGDRPQ